MGVCASVRVRPSVHACVRDVFAIYDDNILPRLIMIIITIIILYFKRIRHTDDFPSTGIPASIPNYPISTVLLKHQHHAIAVPCRGSRELWQYYYYSQSWLRILNGQSLVGSSVMQLSAATTLEPPRNCRYSGSRDIKDRHSGTSPYGHVTSKGTSPLTPRLLSPK